MFWICFDVSRGIGIKSCHSILALLRVVARAWCAPSLLHPQNTCIPKLRLVWFSILLGQIRSIICIIYRCLMVFVDMNDSLSLSRKIYNHIYIYYIYLFVDSHHFTTKSSLQSTSPLRSTRIRGTARLQDLKIASDQWKFVDLVH